MSEFADGYEGVTHAGLAVVARDMGSVLLAQRAFDEDDDPVVQETWEFPGGGLDDGEDPQAGAMREFSEEVVALPPGEVVDGWRAGPEDNYQGFVYVVDSVSRVDQFRPNEEVQRVKWVSLDALAESKGLRPEMRDSIDTWLPLLEAAVSGNQEEFAMTEPMPEVDEAEVDDETLDEPDLTWADLIEFGSIPVHGVLAPEEVESGDKRGFAAGAVTQRNYRLPFMWQMAQTSGHDNAVVVGSVDRLMRKDGLIHWEGSLMPTETASDFVALLAHFGRFPVSVDGDSGSMDRDRTDATGVLWFDAVRASGLTAVSVSAFPEAYGALGFHPEMPSDAALTASMQATGDLITFKRGPGWVTNPKETRRLHAYWTKKGQPGYAKVRWGTPGDFTRAKKLIGEKIAANSPEDMKYLNQIIAQWHHDALGYWPGELGKPGNAPDTPENRKRAARHAKASIEDSTVDDAEIEASEAPENPDIEVTDDGWEAVLTSSARGRVFPPAHYFDRHPDTGALVIEEPDENGLRRTYGYAGEWGVCHIGYEGECVEMPEDPTGAFKEFHLGRTKIEGGDYLNTGLITYKVAHRDAKRILTETAEQAHFDNIKHAWAAVRLGVDERGVWFSGVVLPHVPDEDIVLIEAAGQVSGEWKYGAMRGLQCVNIPGLPVMRSSAAYDDDGNVVALVASAVGAGCAPTPQERFEALKMAHAEAEAERFARLKRELGV